jgi:hypothetical protein
MSGKRTSQLHIDPCYPFARIGMRLLTGYPRLSPVVQDQASAGKQLACSTRRPDLPVGIASARST